MKRTPVEPSPTADAPTTGGRFIRRFLQASLVFSVAPAALASAVAARRSNLQAALAHRAWVADSRFIVTQIVLALGASLLVSIVLAAFSLLAWRDEDRGSALRLARLAFSFWIAALVLYPGFGAWLPVVRALPLMVAFGLCVALLAALHVPFRASWREWALTIATLPLFFGSLSSIRHEVRRTAGRDFDQRDVILVGFDSVSFEDSEAVLDVFQPRAGRKLVFTNAWTPMPITNAAWRSLLSGIYPKASQGLPGVEWPAGHQAWLPRELGARGYRAVMSQDSPGTNTYNEGEDLLVPHAQGWKAILQEYLWKAAFPLSVTGAPWWVVALGGPGFAAGRYAYCAQCFWERNLESLSAAVARGPVLWAVHSCFAHAPVHLSLQEVITIPAWWRRSPIALEGGGNPFFEADARGKADIDAARMRSVRRTVRGVLRELDESGALGHANVFVFSDHGPRAQWVPRERTEHVMLAAFLPGPASSNRIDSPVSLADIAPSLRALLGLPEQPADGVSLPGVVPTAASVERSVRIADPPTFESLGIKLEGLSGADVERSLTLQRNGTFQFAPDLVERVGAANAGAIHFVGRVPHGVGPL